MGPTVWELEGPMPILKSSKRLVFTVIFTTRSPGGEQLWQLYRGPVATGFLGSALTVTFAGYADSLWSIHQFFKTIPEVVW
jgi:hypothetical protein